jgi:hypothetical protein
MVNSNDSNFDYETYFSFEYVQTSYSYVKNAYDIPEYTEAYIYSDVVRCPSGRFGGDI